MVNAAVFMHFFVKNTVFYCYFEVIEQKNPATFLLFWGLQKRAPEIFYMAKLYFSHGRAVIGRGTEAKMFSGKEKGAESYQQKRYITHYLPLVDTVKHVAGR